MKELTTAEKAKRYDEALEKARQFSEHPLQEDSDSIVEYIFPELKESEDERIRKEIIDFIYDKTDTYELREKSNSWLAWLEKQGEQKPTDKVEPKFHEGEWVILTAGELSTTLQIVKVDTNKRLYWFNDNSYLPIVDEDCLRAFEQKPSWSEEDENNFYNAVYACIHIYGKDSYITDWVKSIKQRIGGNY